MLVLSKTGDAAADRQDFLLDTTHALSEVTMTIINLWKALQAFIRD